MRTFVVGLAFAIVGVVSLLAGGIGPLWVVYFWAVASLTATTAALAGARR